MEVCAKSVYRRLASKGLRWRLWRCPFAARNFIQVWWRSRGSMVLTGASSRTHAVMTARMICSTRRIPLPMAGCRTRGRSRGGLAKSFFSRVRFVFLFNIRHKYVWIRRETLFYMDFGRILKFDICHNTGIFTGSRWFFRVPDFLSKQSPI